MWKWHTNVRKARFFLWRENANPENLKPTCCFKNKHDDGIEMAPLKLTKRAWNKAFYGLNKHVLLWKNSFVYRKSWFVFVGEFKFLMISRPPRFPQAISTIFLKSTTLWESTNTPSTKRFTLPETNSAPLKMDGWNTSFLLGRPIFRGKLLVSGRVREPFPGRKKHKFVFCCFLCSHDRIPQEQIDPKEIDSPPQTKRETETAPWGMARKAHLEGTIRRSTVVSSNGSGRIGLHGWDFPRSWLKNMLHSSNWESSFLQGSWVTNDKKCILYESFLFGPYKIQLFEGLLKNGPNKYLVSVFYV